MARLHSSEIQRAAGVSRVPVNVDLSELDRLFADTGPRVIPKGGFTVRDIMAHLGIGRTAASNRIQMLISAGKIEEFGIRPGPGQEKVYREAGN